MADLKSTIELIFKGDDRASNVIDGLDSKFNKFTGRVTAATSPIANLTKSIVAIEVAAAGAAIALGVTAYNASVKYESAVADLSKAFTGTDTELAEFTGQLESLAAEYGVAGTAAIASGADWLKAGKDTADALGLTRLSIENAIAADLDYAESTKALKILTETYGFNVEELRSKLDLLNTVSDNTATTSGQLLDAIQKSAGAADAAGLSFDELLAFLTPAVAKTQEGSEVGNAFKTSLSSLIKPTNDQADALRALGISLTDSNGGLKSGGDLFKELVVALGSADEETKSLTLATLAGAEQFSRMAGVVEGSDTAFSILNGTIGETRTVADETNRVLQTSEKIIDTFKNAVGAAAKTAGVEFNPAIDGILKALTELFGALTQGIKAGALDELFEGISERFGSLQDAIKDVAENLPQALDGLEFSGLLDAIDKVGEAILGIFDVDLTSPEGLRSAIQTIIDALTQLNSFTAGVIEKLEPLFDAIKGIANAAIESGPELAQLAGNISGMATAVNTLLPAMTAFTGVLAAVLGAKGLGALVPGAIAAGKALSGWVVSIGGSGGLLALLGGPAGLAVALAAATGATVSWIAKATGLSDSLRDWAFASADLKGELNDVKQAINNMDFDQWLAELQRTVVTAEKVDAELGGVESRVVNLGKELQSGKDIAGKFSLEALDQIITQSDAAQESVDKLTASFAEQGKIYDPLTGKISDLGEVQGELVKQTDELVDGSKIITQAFFDQASDAGKLALAQQGLVPITKEIIELWRGGPDVVDKLADSSKTLEEQLTETAESGEVAKDKILELKTELEKAKLEAEVKLDIAELEADTEIAKSQLEAVTELAQIKASVDIAEIEAATERIKTSFETIGGIFETTGSTIDNLVDAMAGVDDADKYAREKIEAFTDALDRQLEIQEGLSNSVIELNDAQAAELRARADRLRRGDAVISINGAGLEPELEAFMWKILQSIQVRANADASALLLGI